MEFRKTFLILVVIQSVFNYSIKINPILNTKVQNIKNQCDGNSIQLAQITNSTILSHIPSAVYQSHINELWSAIIISVFLSLVFNRLALTVFKLNLRVNNIEQVIIYKVSEF